MASSWALCSIPLNGVSTHWLGALVGGSGPRGAVGLAVRVAPLLCF